MSVVPPEKRLEDRVRQMQAILDSIEDKRNAAKGIAGGVVLAYANVPPQPTDSEFDAMTATDLDEYGDDVLTLLPTLTPIED